MNVPLHGGILRSIFLPVFAISLNTRSIKQGLKYLYFLTKPESLGKYPTNYNFFTITSVITKINSEPYPAGNPK